MRVECPKCGSTNARYEKTDAELWVRCFCGYLKCVFTKYEHLETVVDGNDLSIKLPRRDTHLFNTLVCLWSIEPANSREVTDTLRFRGHDFTVSDVSSYLMMLKSKGLVLVVEYRRGVPDGSTWECTIATNDLLGVNDN